MVIALLHCPHFLVKLPRRCIETRSLACSLTPSNDDPTLRLQLQRQELSRPKVLVLHPPLILTQFEAEFSRHFHFIKPYESSPLFPIDKFLSTSPAAASATALLASAIAPPVTADGVLRHLPSLRCIVTPSAGVNHIDLVECRRRGIAVANVAEVYSDEVADLAVGLLIDVLIKISAGDRFVRGGCGGEFRRGTGLGGKRVGIVGLGSIGCRVAKRLLPFGCEILYHSRSAKRSLPYTFYPDIHSLAAASDALVICCALTDETRRMVDGLVLLALGSKGVVVNVARGAVVDEREMVRCLVEGVIGGAGLDVFEDEPAVPKDLLGMMDNVVLSPHGAAHTRESFRASYELVVANLKAFFSNQPLLSPVAW